MKEFIVKLWKSKYLHSKPAFSMRTLTSEDFTCTIKWWEDLDYKRVGFRATCTLDPAIVAEVKEKLDIDTKGVFEFGRKVEFNYKGCRTDAHREKAIDKARKELQQKCADLGNAEQFYLDAAAEKAMNAFRNTQRYNNRDYHESFLGHFSKESTWNFKDESDTGKEVAQLEEDIKKLEEQIKENENRIREIKIRVIKEYIKEQGENRLADEDVPPKTYEAYLKKIEEDELFKGGRGLRFF